MNIEVKVIEDSMSPAGVRLTTLQLKYPRFIHAEFMTHRMFSRNASSSRAIPVAKMIEQVRHDPAMPIHWGVNKPGMQATSELTGDARAYAEEQWRLAANYAANYAENMNSLGVHKQVANRILEPFQFIHVVVTATEWENFFALRAHPAAQPEIHALAVMMRDAMSAHQPRQCEHGDWHLPYIRPEERGMDINDLVRMSAARCARVSYIKHDGSNASNQEDFELFDRLIGSSPMHASPVEHQAYPVPTEDAEALTSWSGNFNGWVQYRKMLEVAATSATPEMETESV